MVMFTRMFGRPTGVLGWLAGRVMAVKNGARSRRALALLDARPGERVLEVGFGPGLDVARLAAAVGGRGLVAGCDLSPVMLAQARARNRGPIEDARVELRLGDACALPWEDGLFDAVISTNSAQFWSDLGLGMQEIVRVLAPGGRAVVVVQPLWRGPGTARRDADRWRLVLADAMTAAGLEAVSAELLQELARPAAAVRGRRAATG